MKRENNKKTEHAKTKAVLNPVKRRQIVKKLVSVSGDGFSNAHKIGIFEIRFNIEVEEFHFKTLKEAKEFHAKHRPIELINDPFSFPMKIEKGHYLVEKHTHKKKMFTSLREAKYFYDQLQEPAVFWDNTKFPEVIDCKQWE